MPPARDASSALAGECPRLGHPSSECSCLQWLASVKRTARIASMVVRFGFSLGQGCPHDAISPVAEMRTLAAAIPDAEFVVLEDSGHMSPLENPRAFNAALDGFLNRVRKA